MDRFLKNIPATATKEGILLLVIDPGEDIHPQTSERNLSPKADWEIIGLMLNRLKHD